MKYLILLLCGLLPSVAAKNEKRLSAFPVDFLFGVATSAYQTEGAWNVDDKGISMWDHLVRTNPDSVAGRANGDDACKSYYLYKRDIEMLKELGVKTYRFSISWPRIMPNGRPDYVNPLGITHYNKIIDELIANDIAPFVTMYHWDLPQNLSEHGGWLNEDIVDWFGDYTRVLFQNFGDRVKHWLTINEPYIHCLLGYATGVHAPQVRVPATGFYDCGRHILLANARAYHIYNEEFRATQNGQLGLVYSMNWPQPATDSQDDYEAALTVIAFSFDHFAHPIFSEQGNYPQLLIDRVAARSAEEGFNASRLRPLTEEQINYIKGSADFFALNTYGTDMIFRNASLEGMFEVPSAQHDAYFLGFTSPFEPMDGSHELREYVPGFYKLLTYVKDQYNNPPLYIMENGYSTQTKGLVDDMRVAYIRNYLTALLAARADGANVKGYIVWNLMDDFEWNFGYLANMGLYEVDMSHPNRTRVPRKSAHIYKEIIRSKVIDYSYDYDPLKRNDSHFIKPSMCLVLIASLLKSILNCSV